MSNKFKPSTRVYKRKCQEIEILIFYRMILHRISRHLSPEEVSFLMGKPLDFLTRIETFRIKQIFMHDVLVMNDVLEINNLDTMVHMGVNISSEQKRYELHMTKLADRVIYQLYKVNEEQEQRVTEFKLIDIRHDIDPYESSTADEGEKIAAFLDGQIDAGYFSEEKEPYEVHKLCCEKLEKYIRPKNLMKVLDDLLSLSDERKIVRKESPYGVVYVLAAHAESTEKK